MGTGGRSVVFLKAGNCPLDGLAADGGSVDSGVVSDSSPRVLQALILPSVDHEGSADGVVDSVDALNCSLDRVKVGG